EERIEAQAGPLHDRARRFEGDLVALAYDEGRKCAAGFRWPPHRRPRPRRQQGASHGRVRLECAVDDELQAGRFPGRGLKRPCEHLMIVFANPIESEDARYFHDELSVLPCGRPKRGDPGVEVLRDQATAKLPSHLPPDGVEHPPALVVPIATRIPRDVVTTSYPHMGRTRGISPRPSRSRLRSPPTPSPHAIALPHPRGTASKSKQ